MNEGSTGQERGARRVGRGPLGIPFELWEDGLFDGEGLGFIEAVSINISLEMEHFTLR